MRYRVTEVHQTTYRGKSDGPVDIVWTKDADELGALNAVLMILDNARNPGSGRFPSLKSTTHAIRIELVTEES